MAESASIHLPLFQRFDCHRCGYCCRYLVVNVTDTERRTILAAGWSERISDQPLFASYRFRRRRLHRLTHRPGGGCVFLGADGQCRLQAETGLETKPLACRLYPFVPVPGINSVRIDLRADCPSVAANRGRSLTVHRAMIAELAAETGAAPMSQPPAWPGQRTMTGREFEAVVAAFEGLLRKGSIPLRARLAAGGHLLDLLYSLRIRRVTDDRFVELMGLLADAALEQVRPAGPAPPPPLPPRAARLLRQWLFLHAVSDDPQALSAGPIRKMLGSWRRYGQARRFAGGTGPVPVMAADWPRTDFESVGHVEVGPDETLEPVARSLRVRLQAHAVAGPGYFGYDLLSGLTALWLLPAVAGWFARLAAVSAGRPALTAEDVLAGVRRAHHTYGVSPVFARISERLRLRALARPGVPGALLAAYGP